MNFDKKIYLLSLLKFSESCVMLRYILKKASKKRCKDLEKSEKSGVVQRNVKIEKRWKIRPWTQKIGVDTAENELRKGSEKRVV